MTPAELAELERVAREAIDVDASASAEWAYSTLRNCIDTTQVAKDGTLHDALEIGVLGAGDPTEEERIELRAAVFARNTLGTLARGILSLLASHRAAVEEVERLKKEQKRYRTAVAAQLHYDMKSVVSDTPENRSKKERAALAAEVERLRGLVGTLCDVLADEESDDMDDVQIRRHYADRAREEMNRICKEAGR